MFSLMKEDQLIAELRRNPFVLAPMAGITDCAFRSFMREMGCGVVITELVSATGLKYSSDRTRKLMEFDESQHPVGIQLFGEELEHLAYAAQVSEQLGADFIDLNFGCPVPKVTKKGAGSALLKDLPRAKLVFASVKQAVGIPVTVKIRTGWDESSRNSSELIHIAREEGLSWVAIHGRTRAAGYSGQADWDYIASVAQTSPLPIIGNGDIQSAEAATRRFKTSGCAAVMIGRGCLRNPWIFLQIQNLLNGETAELKRDFVKAFARLEFHLRRNQDEKIIALQLKKFAAWFSTGYPNAGALRKKIFTTKTLTEVNTEITDFFGVLTDLGPADVSHQPFLMGGHG
jgi:tRNA-dihydrouridine synthase B